jgi:hypothetical protein
MKIFLGTLNGGGNDTLIRLYKSIQKCIIPQLSMYQWKWVVLSQGSKGAKEDNLIKIKNQLRDNFTGFLCSENIGVATGTNDLIDYFKELNYDYFWMIDDDIEFINDRFFVHMIHALEHLNKKTCATVVCYFGQNRVQYRRQTFQIIDTCDHGSGCTLYNKVIYDKCGYYDENLKQYGTDSEFNNRIRLVFGDKSLSLIGGNLTNHYNQTGTFNCYSKDQWNEIVKIDSEYLKNKKYDSNNIFQPRCNFKFPFWKNPNFVKII